MKQVTKLLALAALLVAGQAMHAQAPAPTTPTAVGADVPELMRQLEQKKLNPNNPFINIDMQGKKLQGAQLINADLSGAIFTGSDLSNANLSNAILTHTILANTNLTNTNFTNAHITATSMGDVNLTQTNFSGAHLIDVFFINCLGFNTTILNNKTSFYLSLGLTDEQLAYAHSKGALKVPGKDLRRLQNLISERDIDTTPINMPNADLQYANLSPLALNSVNLSGANLIEASLKNTTLTNTNLSGANLTKADFTGCWEFNTTILDNRTNFQGAIGLTTEQKAYARSKGAQNVPN